MQDDPKYKQAMRARKPEQRLRAFLALCGGKRVCDFTGGPQPQYRLESMRIMAEFPKPKDDDDLAPEAASEIERKQACNGSDLQPLAHT